MNQVSLFTPHPVLVVGGTAAAAETDCGPLCESRILGGTVIDISLPELKSKANIP